MSGSPNGTPPGGQVLRKIGDFELISKLGQGAMGSVFKARQGLLDRIVALKILPPSIAQDQAFIERFVREARASARLSHPNIVAGIDVGQDPTTKLWYFAMEYIDGPTVRQMQERQARIPEDQALKIARDIANALDCAHQAGMVHRDVKPDNILMMRDGTAKLADLGLARQTHEDSSLTQSGQALGTPYYMAPEQARGENETLDTRADLYALGATLFHMVTGALPFTGETAAVIMAKHLTEAPPSAQRVNPEVSQGCSRLILRLMQKDKAKRYQTPAEVADQIERLLKLPADARGGTTAARRAVRSPTGAETAVRGTTAVQDALRGRRSREEAPPSTKNRQLPLILGAVAGLMLVAVIGLLAFGGNGPTRVAKKEEPAKPEVVPPAPVPVPAAPAKNEPAVNRPPVVKEAPRVHKVAPPIAEPVVPVKKVSAKPVPADPQPKVEPATGDGKPLIADVAVGEIKPAISSRADAPPGVEAQSATIYWLMADNMDIYHNGKPLREYSPSFQTRPDEARRPKAYSARIRLSPGDVFTVGGRRGGSYGGTVVVVDENDKPIWWSNTTDWHVYEPADRATWYLPEVAGRSKQRPVQRAQSFGYQAVMRRSYDGKPVPIWGDPSQRFVYMVGAYRKAEPAQPAPEVAGVLHEKAELAYQALFKEAAPLLMKNRFDDAIALFDRKSADPGLKAAAELLEREKADMQAVSGVRDAALEALRGRVGETVKLRMGDRVESGEVQADANRKGVTLNVGGPVLTFPAERICAEDVDRYAPKAVQPEDLRLRGVMFLYAGDADRAKEYLDMAQKSGAPIDRLQIYLDRIAVMAQAETAGKGREATDGKGQSIALLPPGAVLHMSFEKDTLIREDERWYLRDPAAENEHKPIAWLSGVPELVKEGVKGSAYGFAGAGDAISTKGDEMSVSHEAGTISLWVRAADPKSTRNILHTEEHRDRAIWTEAGRFKASMFTGARFEILSGGVVDTSWHHVVFSWDIKKGILLLYVDAKLIDTREGRSWESTVRSASTLYGGARAAEHGLPARQAFSGLFDEVTVWSRVLTPEEVKQLYLVNRR